MAIFRDFDGSLVIGEGDLLSKSELGAKLHLSRSTIQRLLRKGLPCKRYCGNVCCFLWSEVLEWLLLNGYESVK